ncbi:hypothetical protein HYV30_01635 [Candidatus Kaiserbacteria bacterium]|nr:hypothetical protein [Candidatus Kaiserbacteria bacterium]
MQNVRENIKTADTKADLYFILKRYVYNGGNIYEIYDYIESHPELAFLKEAESVYPYIFELIRSRRVSHAYSDNGMYAYLAYLEAAERSGYADIATIGTAASQYAKMAYYKTYIRREQREGRLLTYPRYTEKAVEADVLASQNFLAKAGQSVSRLVRDGIINTAENNPLSIINGTEAYGSALRYLSALGISISPVVSAREAYAFSAAYAYRTIPQLYLSVSLSNASTLLISRPTSASELRNAIYPFLTAGKPEQTGIVGIVIRARLQNTTARFRDFDVASKRNIVAIANIVPEFKNWLLINGWLENDFK